MFLTVHFVNIGFRNKNKSGEWPLAQLISRINYLSVKSWSTPVSKITGRSVSRIQGDCTRRGAAVWGPGPRTWHPFVDLLSYKPALESSHVTFFHIINNITRRRIFLYRSAQTTCLGLNGLVDPSDNHILLYLLLLVGFTVHSSAFSWPLPPSPQLRVPLQVAKTHVLSRRRCVRGK